MRLVLCSLSIVVVVGDGTTCSEDDEHQSALEKPVEASFHGHGANGLGGAENGMQWWALAQHARTLTTSIVVVIVVVGASAIVVVVVGYCTCHMSLSAAQ